MYGLVEYIPLLLRHGANLESRKYDSGYTPLTEGVRCNQPAAVEMLLQSGADTSTKSFWDENIVHVCARNSDAATIRALANAGLRNIDTNAEDARGMSPRKYLERRQQRSKEVEDCLEELFKSISRS